MAIRILPLLIVGALSGCTNHGLLLPKGVYVNNCLTPATVEPARPTSCMTRAEYRTARKQVMHSWKSSAAGDEAVEEVQVLSRRIEVAAP